MAESTVLNYRNYTLEFDGIRNWTLSKREKTTHHKAKGEETNRHVGYYGTLEAALISLAREEQGNAGYVKIAEAIDACRELEKSIRSEVRMWALPTEVPTERLVEA